MQFIKFWQLCTLHKVPLCLFPDKSPTVSIPFLLCRKLSLSGQLPLTNHSRAGPGAISLKKPTWTYLPYIVGKRVSSGFSQHVLYLVFNHFSCLLLKLVTSRNYLPDQCSLSSDVENTSDFLIMPSSECLAPC